MRKLEKTRYQAGMPRTDNGALLFLQTMLAKMKAWLNRDTPSAELPEGFTDELREVVNRSRKYIHKKFSDRYQSRSDQFSSILGEENFKPARPTN